MLIQTKNRTDENGNIIFKEGVNVFNVQDYGNGIARGELKCSKKPYEKGRDQALLAAGYTPDKNGYITGKIFASFRGDAYDKVLKLHNGAVIEDMIIDIDPFPYVNKDGEVAFRPAPQWTIIDFTERTSRNNNNSNVSYMTVPEKEHVVSPMYAMVEEKNKPVEPEY